MLILAVREMINALLTHATIVVIVQTYGKHLAAHVKDLIWEIHANTVSLNLICTYFYLREMKTEKKNGCISLRII